MGHRLIIAGATGMVGGLALRDALARPEVEAVTSIGRRPTGIDDPKLTEIEHADFSDLSAVADAFEGHDTALFCIGVYTGSVPDEQFREITVDHAVAFGTALHAANPDAALSFLSGAGADPSGKARMAFARYKGQAEKALSELGLGRLHIFRPGYIYPVTPRTEPNFSYRVTRALWPAVRLVWPNAGIPSEALARAMVHAALHGTGEHTEPVLENRDIRALAERIDEAR